MSLGNKIKKQRLKCKLTQSQLASNLNVSDKTISSWENDRTIPDINLIFKLADTLKTSLYTFINEESYNLDNLELEIKLKVDLKEWNRVLNIIEKDSSYLENENHLATYFKPQADTFKNQWLRIRNENGKYMLNYKKLIDNKCCNEYETIIDNQINLEKILECLNFKKIGIIEKTRIKYLYNKKYEFSFDQVTNIGNFIEIEVKNMTKNRIGEYNELIKLLDKLKINLSLIDTKRYPDYLIGEENDK